jgi:hypothetical protein
LRSAGWWKSASYNTPIQTTASYPIIGLTALLNLVDVVDKLTRQTVEEKGTLCQLPSSPPASRSQRAGAPVGAAPRCESPSPDRASQSVGGAPTDQLRSQGGGRP